MSLIKIGVLKCRSINITEQKKQQLNDMPLTFYTVMQHRTYFYNVKQKIKEKNNEC